MQATLSSVFQKLAISPCFRANFSKINGTFARSQHAPTPNPMSVCVQQVRCIGVFKLTSLPNSKTNGTIARSQHAPTPNPMSVCVQQVRCVGVFKQTVLPDLWKSISVVSKSGMRRGRGKKSNSKLITDLQFGLKRGEGPIKMKWPGLNTPVIKGATLARIEKLTEGEIKTSAEKLATVRQEQLQRRKASKVVHPLEQGFTRRAMKGSILNYDPSFQHQDFKYSILIDKLVSYMCPKHGRAMRFSVTVVCGNEKGMIGFASGSGNSKMSSIRSASSKAIKRLIYIPRLDDRTILHDFYTQFYKSKIFVSQKPEGYGLRCHRLIRVMCKLIGIKDLHAQCEGSRNNLNILKAFLLGLVRQRSYEDMVAEKKLHLVAIDKQRRDVPTLLASPEECRKKEEIPSSESLDFKQFSYGDRVRLWKKKPPPFYKGLPSWQNFLQKTETQRGKQLNKWRLMAQYGGIKSFLSAKFPEAKSGPTTK